MKTNKKQNRWRRSLRKLANFFKRNDWTRGALAKDTNDIEVPFHNKRAVKFCLNGGVCKSLRDYEINKVCEILDLKLGGTVNFNDKVCKSKEELISKLEEIANAD